jgi:hypothetical protein
MYAKRGSDKKDGGDEFVTVWGADPKLDLLTFSCSAGGQDYHLLVIHGCDYPGDLQRAFKLMTEAVEAGLALPELKEKLSELVVGLVFHPRKWGDTEKDRLASDIEKYLKSKNISVAFVKQFSHGTPLETSLAPQSRATLHDFSKGFIEAWNFFFLPTKTSETKHSINSLFNVIDQDLQWWKDINFEDSEEARKVFGGTRERDLVALLQEAKRIVQGDANAEAGASESITSIAEQVARDVPEQKEAIEKALNEVLTLFDSSVCAEAERTLCILNNRTNKPADEVLSDLREQVQDGKSFLEWYYKLDVALKKLKDELTRNYERRR